MCFGSILFLLRLAYMALPAILHMGSPPMSVFDAPAHTNILAAVVLLLLFVILGLYHYNHLHVREPVREIKFECS
jgi:hypothetical protein